VGGIGIVVPGVDVVAGVRLVCVAIDVPVVMSCFVAFRAVALVLADVSAVL